jgi:hypothetical protein
MDPTQQSTTAESYVGPEGSEGQSFNGGFSATVVGW